MEILILTLHVIGLSAGGAAVSLGPVILITYFVGR